MSLLPLLPKVVQGGGGVVQPDLGAPQQPRWVMKDTHSESESSRKQDATCLTREEDAFKSGKEDSLWLRRGGKQMTHQDCGGVESRLEEGLIVTDGCQL